MTDENLNYVTTLFDWIEANRARSAKEEGLRTLLKLGGEYEMIAKELFSVALDWFRIFHIGTLPAIDEYRCSGIGKFAAFVALVQKAERGEIGRSYGQVMEVLHTFTPTTAKWLRRAILKDLRMGVKSTTVNKFWPGLIRTFECQLAESVIDPEKIIYPVFQEPKVDGVRCLCFIENGVVKKISRGGGDLLNLDHFDPGLLAIAAKFKEPIVLDTEVFVGNLHRTLGLVTRSKTPVEPGDHENVQLNIFDILLKSDWDGVSKVSQMDRKTMLMDLPMAPNMQALPFRIVNNPQEVEALYQEHLSAKYEGSMLKIPSSAYTFGRSWGWMKYKPYDVDEFKIVGAYPGSGRLEGMLGGFDLQISKDTTCSVGGGFSDEQRVGFWAAREIIIGSKARVKYKEKTPDGKLREPVFVELVK